MIRLAMRFWPALGQWLVGDRSYLHDRMLRRYDLLTQLHHEMNKVRQGGYWMDCGYWMDSGSPVRRYCAILGPTRPRNVFRWVNR